MVTLSEDNNRGVRQTEQQVRVPLNYLNRGRYVGGPKRFELIRAAFDVGEKFEGLALTAVSGDKVVELSKDKRRENPGLRLAEHGGSGGVVGLSWIDRSQDTAGIHNDQTAPNPVR